MKKETQKYKYGHKPAEELWKGDNGVGIRIYNCDNLGTISDRLVYPDGIDPITHQEFDNLKRILELENQAEERDDRWESFRDLLVKRTDI